MSSRSLPDLKTRFDVDTSQLTAAELKAAGFGSKVSGHMGVATTGVQKFEKATASSSRLLGESGRTMEGVAGKVGALTGLQGYGAMGFQVLALTAGVGALAEGLHSAVEITEAQDRALNSLQQAVGVTGGNFEAAKKQVQDFIDTNRRYIPNQAQVIEGTAKLTREGLNAYQLQRDQNIALDLAATKHITYSEAVDIVAKAEAGRLRGLADLGIKTTHLTDANADAITKGKALSQVLDEVAAKEKGGRQTLTQLEQSQNELNNDWTDVATRVGPPLIGLFDAIVQGIDWVVKGLEALGANKDWNKYLYWAFGNVQGAIVGAVHSIEDFIGDIKWLLDNAGKVAGMLGGGTVGGTTHPGPARQHGGLVLPGYTYDVGETAPEKLIMAPGGGAGYVVPNTGPRRPAAEGGSSNGGGGGLYVNVYAQTNADARDIAAEMGWEVRKLRRFG